MTDSHRLTLLAPIVKVITVNAPLERAFARFTREIARWWPLHSHSVGEADAPLAPIVKADRLAELDRPPLRSPSPAP
jgi:hypothetical protein